MSFSREQQKLTMDLAYAKMLAIVMCENMKFADDTLNNDRLTFVNTKLLPKYWRIVALILLPYTISIILKLKGHIRGRLISRPKCSKTANKSASIHTNKSFFLAIGCSYLHGLFKHVFKRIETAMK